MQKSFLKNVSLIVSGSAIAQIIAFSISPILTRIYTPSEFGQFSIILSAINILAIILTLRSEYILLLTSSLYKTKSSLHSSIAVVLVMTSIAILSFWGLSITLPSNPYLNLSKFGFYIIIGAFTYSLWSIFLQFFTKIKHFTKHSTSNIVKQSAVSTLQIASSNFFTNGLISGKIIGDFIGTSYLGILVKRFISVKLLFKSCLPINLGSYLKDNLHITFTYSTHSIINVLSNTLPLILFELLFSTALTGQLGLTLRIMLGPVTIISYALSQVINSDISSRRIQSKPIRPFINKYLKTYGGTGLFLSAIIFFFIPDLFTFIFGSNWVTAGEYAQAIIPLVLLISLTSPMSFIPQMHGKSRTALIFESLNLIVRVISLYIGAINNNPYLSILLFAITGSLLQAFLLSWYYKICDFHLNE
jgi:O-antigen/teichoic acid export membrane protein